MSGDGSLAIDGANNLWLAASSGLTKVNTAGTVLGIYTGGGYAIGQDNYPAIDNNGNVWITSGTAAVSEFSSSGTALSPSSGFGGPSPQAHGAPAIDASNNLWTVDNGSELYEMSSTGAVLSPSGGYPDVFLSGNFGTGVDGSGTIWVTGEKGILSFNSFGVVTTPVLYSPGADGFSDYQTIDASGNLWFTGVLARGSNPIGLIEDVGLAAPTITPLSSASGMQQLGTRPGTPIPVVLTSTEIPSTYGPNIAYTAQLQATGGNTGTYVWTIASGTLPNGFNLNSSTGLISGQSSAKGTSSFIVQVCDAQNATNCASRAFTLTGPFSGGSLPALGGESLLKGNYVFRITGRQNAGASSGSGSVEGMAMVGFVTLSGTGGVTQGDFYVVSPQGSSTDPDPIYVTGSYDLPTGGNGTGRLAFADGFGNWYQFSIAADKIVGGAVQELRLTEFDDTQVGTGNSGGAMASGIAKLQTGGNISNYLEQNFAFGLEGETPCTNYNNTNPGCLQTVAPFGPIAAAGVLTGTSGLTISGKLDASGVGTSYNNVTLTGTWTEPMGTIGDRGFFTLAYTGTLFPVPPTHFIYYPVSTSEFFFISTDSHANTSLLSGDAIAQTATFTNATFNGIYLGTESVASGGDGQSVYGSTVNSTIHFIDSNGVTAAIAEDENAAGTANLDVVQADSSYSVDASGRATFTQAGLPIFYLANGAQGFGVEQPAAGTAGGLITLTQQTNVSYDASSLSGTYAFDDLSVPAQNTTADGVLTSDAVSAGTISADEVSSGGLLSSPAQSLSYTMSTDGRGTLTLVDGTGYILWLLSPTQWIALPTGTDPKPLILTGTQQ